MQKKRCNNISGAYLNIGQWAIPVRVQVCYLNHEYHTTVQKLGSIHKIEPIERTNNFVFPMLCLSGSSFLSHYSQVSPKLSSPLERGAGVCNFCGEIFGGLNIFAYVLMINHVYLIASSPDMIGFLRDFRRVRF